MADVLGKYSFLDLPDVNGTNLLLELNPVMTGTGSLLLPKGTTAQRPATPIVGMFRFNTTLNSTEYYDGTSWVPRSTPVSYQYLYQEIGQSSFTNSIIPYDTTTPTTTEGTQYSSISITTTTATSKIVGRFNAWFDTSTNNRTIIMASFRGTTCIDAAAVNAGTSGRPVSGACTFIDAPGSIGTFTYSIRIGTDSNTTIYVNRGTTATFGGISSSQLTLQEIV